jgi:hypothetical protein
MSRTVPAAILAALAGESVELFYAVEMNFSTLPVRLWTGLGDRAIGDTIAANQIQIGQKYVIQSVGTTDFTLIGADSNTVGLSFVATGVGTGTGTVKFAYIGSGTLLSISGIEEVADLSAKGITLTLSGVDTSLVSLAIQEPYQGRSARVLLGVTGVNEFVEVFAGLMDVMTLQEDGSSATIELTVESKLVTLQRPNVRRYTSASQKLRYSTDTFFDYVEELQDKEIAWGRKIS